MSRPRLRPLVRRGGVDDSKALAAYIGRRRYGVKRFASIAQDRKRKGNQ